MRNEELTRQYLYDLQDLIHLIQYRIRKEVQFGYKSVNIKLPRKDLDNKFLMEDLKEYFQSVGCTFDKYEDSVLFKWE